MSNLVNHAEYELKQAGLYEPDSDYEGALAEGVVELVEVFSKQGHSGASAALSIDLLTRLLRFEPLTPLSNNPLEWIEVGYGLWQNSRDGKAFSNDGGKTYTRNDEDGKVHTSVDPGDAHV